MVRSGQRGRRNREQLRSATLSADDFVGWAAAQPQGRFELMDGQVVAMAPERMAHTRAKLRAVNALAASIVASGLDCEAVTDGASIRIDDHTVYGADALVRCGPPVPDDAQEVTDPIIVVEILSPSSRGIDTGLKLDGYFRLPSVRHYLVLNTDSRVVLHHHRDDRGAIGVQILHEGTLSLDPPGLVVQVSDLFASS
ncbi:Uma2 family endonuclease [soil metagenome]